MGFTADTSGLCAQASALLDTLVSTDNHPSASSGFFWGEGRGWGGRGGWRSVFFNNLYVDLSCSYDREGFANELSLISVAER